MTSTLIEITIRMGDKTMLLSRIVDFGKPCTLKLGTPVMADNGDILRGYTIWFDGERAEPLDRMIASGLKDSREARVISNEEMKRRMLEFKRL